MSFYINSQFQTINLRRIYVFFRKNRTNYHRASRRGFCRHYLDTDTELYIDPTLIDGLPTSWCEETKQVLSDYFDNVFECCKNKDHDRLELVDFGKEPNETRLGLSIEQSQGKGSKPESLRRIFLSVSNQGLIEKGIVKNPSELCVFVKNFAEGRMSDLITNVIRKQLYVFTVQQCSKHNSTLSEDLCKIGQYWDANEKQ